jgi:arylsulfatase A-like enzyme
VFSIDRRRDLSTPVSVVLVTVDCLRADHTGFMGYAQPTTPFLDQLAAESMVFPKAIAAGAPTYYSFPGILASRFPLALGRDVVGIAPGELTLATVLQQAGYRTAAYVAANPYLSRRFGYAQGFEVFRDFLSEQLAHTGETTPRARTRLNQQIAELAHKVSPLGRLYDELYLQYCQRIALPRNETWDSLRRFPAANVLVDQACAWLSSLDDEPFFLWLHFMDPHAPYYPPAEALKAMGGERISPDRGRYLNALWNGDPGAKRLSKARDEIVVLHDAGIRWVDAQLARLVESLRSSDAWDSCMFVLTADHGEEFLDHGGRFHPPSRAYQEILQVPLLMRVPGAAKKALSESPLSLVHLAPTILEVLGMDVPEEFEGRNYWSEVQTGEGWDVAVSESIGSCTNPMDARKRLGARVLVVQDRKFKLVLGFDNKEENLFDLERDPHELQPLPRGAERTTRGRLLRAALNHLERRPSQRRQESAIRARLHQIGLEWDHLKIRSEIPAS